MLKLPKQIFAAALLLTAVFAFSCGRGVEDSFNSGQEFLRTGKFGDAEIQFRKVLATEPKHQGAKVGLAESLSRQGKVLEAWDAYGEASKEAPRDLKILLARIEIGYVALRNGPSRMRVLEEEVISLCNQAIQIKPDAGAALRTRGYLALRLGDVADARRDYEAALAASPQDAETLKALFAIWANAGETQRGIQTVEGILARNPRFEEAYRILYSHYMRRKQFTEAKAVLAAKHKVNGESSAAALEMAAHEENAGNPEAARRLLDELEAKRPGTAKYRMDLVEYHARFGRLDAALAEVEKGLSGFPAQKMIFLHEKARLLNAKGQVREAADLLAAAYAEFPKNSDLLKEEAQLRAALHEDPAQRAKADLLFAKLRTLSPVPDGTEALFIRFLNASGREAEGAKVLAEAVKQYSKDVDIQLLQASQALAISAPGKAMPFASRAFSLRPSSPEAVVTLAECLLSNGLAKAAAELLEDWRENNRPSLEADIMLAAAYAQMNKKPQALGLLDKAAAGKQTTAGQAITMSAAYLAAGAEVKAFSVLESAIRTRPQSEALLAAKAKLLEQAGRRKDALSLARQLAEHVKKADIQLQIARLEGALGNTPAAVEAIQRAEQIAPSHPEVLLAKVAVLEADSRYPAAEKILRQLFADEPRSGRIANALAWNLAMQGRAPEGKSIAEIAVKEEPSNVNYRDTAAWISLQLKELNQARAVYQDLLRQDTRNAAIHYHFVEVLLAMGDPIAKSEYAKAISKGAPPTECKNIANKIKAYDLGGI